MKSPNRTPVGLASYEGINKTITKKPCANIILLCMALCYGIPRHLF